MKLKSKDFQSHIFFRESKKDIVHLLSKKLSKKTKVFVFYDKKISFPQITSHPRYISKKLSVNENLKSLEQIQSLYNFLLKNKVDRDSHILAIGGGALLDSIGFVASTILRGIQWSSVPTTLLAQVDSAIGGKTAVNFKGKKNMIGSFHSPSYIFISPSFLKSLPQREITSGLGECFKYSILTNKKLSQEISLASIKAYVRTKKKYIEEDFYDKKGFREQLNLGHTLAHSLEACEGSQKWRHGEAVLRGIHFNAYLSQKMGLMSERNFQKITSSLTALSFPQISKKTSAIRLIKAMSSDKKNSEEKFTFILFAKPGEIIKKQLRDRKQIKRYLEEYVRSWQ